MGEGLRIFIVNDDNSLKRLALRRYERLMQRDPDISFPQYAGKRVQYAEVAIEFENRDTGRSCRTCTTSCFG